MALADLGEVARATGEYARAASLYQESLELRSRRGFRGPALASLEHNLGAAALAMGECASAGAHFLEALQEFAHLGERRGVADCLSGLGTVLLESGQAREGVRLLGAAAAAFEALGSEPWPSNRRAQAHAIAGAQGILGQAAFAAAWQEGWCLPVEEAVALACRRTEDVSSATPRASG